MLLTISALVVVASRFLRMSPSTLARVLAQGQTFFDAASPSTFVQTIIKDGDAKHLISTVCRHGHDRHHLRLGFSADDSD